MNKILLSIAGLVGFVAIIGSGSDQSSNQVVAQSPVAPYTQQATIEAAVPKPAARPVVLEEEVEVKAETPTYEPASGNSLSNDNYYTNVDGNKVHSPAYSNDGDVPAGASARCKDGTYSFSQNRRGTCSGHGGVASWL